MNGLISLEEFPVNPNAVPVARTTPSATDLSQITNTVDNGAALMLGTAVDRGNEVALQNQIIQDRQTLSPLDFEARYGPDVVRQMDMLAGADAEQFLLENTPRGALARVGDNANNIFTGLVGGVGDAATFVGGMVNEDVGRVFSDGTAWMREGMQSLQSLNQQRNRQMSGIRAELDSQDNLIEYERDIEDGESGFVAGLSYLGRGLVNGAARFWEDPASLETGLSEGVGSLFAGGVIGRGAGLAGRLAGLGRRSTQAMMPAAIGAMEGGSAYSGAMQQVMGMTHDELFQTSPTYREMISQGMDPEAAKEAVASSAAEIAGMVQAPIGALTGRLVAGFEANPLGSRGFRDMVGNILRETVEEGSQSASGQFAQNLGVQQADENQMLMEGIGDATSQGAILGSLTTGVVQAPSVPGASMRAAGAALRERAETIRARNEAGSGVTDADISAAAATVAEALPSVAEAADAMINSVSEDIRPEIGASSLKTRIQNAVRVTDADFEALGPQVQEYMAQTGLDRPGNRMELLAQTARMVVNENSPMEAKLSGALFILDEMNKQEKLFNEDLEEGKGGLDQTSDEYNAINQYQTVMAQITSNATMKSAMEWAAKMGPVEKTEDVVRAATAKPSAITPTVGRTVLKQADEGSVSLTPQQRKTLQNAVDVVQITERAQAQIAQSDQEAEYETDAVKDVGEQVLTRGRQEDWGLSIDQHVGRINSAIQSGDMEAGGAAMRHFGNFAASQRNKALAAIQSLREGGEKGFARAGAYGKRNPVDGKITIRPNSPGSMAFGRRVILEANMLIDQTNMLMDNNPELGMTKRLKKIELPKEMFGVETRTQEVQKTQEQTQEQTPETTPETTPEMVVEETVVEETVVEDNQQPNVFEEAALVVEATPEPVMEEDTRSLIERKFPLLVKAKEAGSRFYQAFKADKMGRFLEYGDPLNDFIAALDEVHVASQFNLDANEVSGLADYLEMGRDIISGGAGSLNHRLKEFSRIKYSDGKTFADMIKEGRDVAGSNQGRAIAILEKTDNGYRYNPALIQTAVMASLHWFSGSQNRETRMDKEDLAKLTGLKVEDISNTTLEQFNSGVGLTQAARGLAENITQFWGMNPNRDAPENLTKGIPEAIAKEILAAMEAKGFMSSEYITVPGSDKQFKQYHFKQNIDDNIRSTLKKMGPAKKLIELAGLTEDVRQSPTYEVPPKGIAPTQMRNRVVKNTRAQRGVIRKAQSIAFNFYRNSFDMQQAIGKDAWIEMMGSTVIEEGKPFNEEHKKSVEGRNLTIGMAFDHLVDQVRELEAFADKAGKPAEEINKYYQFNYSRVNRLQMLGLVNPQSDKIARHVFLPTKRVIDMSNEAGDAAMGFFMSLAQGLGVKNQKFTPAENIAMAKKMTLEEGGTYSALVTELAEWLRDGKKGSLANWSQRLRQVDPRITEHGVMSLLSAAEYANARDTGQGLKSFTTHSYFEADGVTNGPANALMNLTARISPSWLKTIRKTGSFVGVAGQTMVTQANQDDLYTTGANILADIQRNTIANLPDNVRSIHTALFNMMQGLGMEITLTQQDDMTMALTIKRGVLKNPLTITIYGSGIDGIAGNVTTEIMERFYAALSEHMQSGKNLPFGEGMEINGKPYGAQQFWGDLNHVLTNLASKDEGEWTVIRPKFAQDMKGIPSNTQLEKMSIGPNEFRTLKDNVRALFVDDMARAIEEAVMGHVQETVDTIQKATNAQSIVMHYLFRRELLRAMAERKTNRAKFPNWKPGDFLSQNEMDEILTRLMPFGARINTATQSYFLGSGERGNLLKSIKINIDGKDISVNMPNYFSKDLMDRSETDAYAMAPSIAGVAGVPSFNIGTGDGRMIDVFLENLKGYGVLPVFDGINLPVDQVFNGSQAANAAVMQSWTENPVQYVAESFKGFLRQNPLDQMMDINDPYNVERDALIADLSRNAEGLRNAEPWSVSALAAHFDDLMGTLDEHSEQIGTRIEAMKQLPMSVDQMAGGSTPYTQDGTVDIPAGTTDTGITTIIERVMDKIRAGRKKQDAVEAPSRTFVAAFKSKAMTDPDTGALVADLPALEAIRKTLNNKLPNAQREMLNASLSALGTSDYTVIFGPPEVVDRWERNNFPDSYEGNGASYFGKIDVDNRVIYLTNPSAETLAHEMIHAATITKMQGYYTDPNLVTVADGEAIARLEGLMNEWLTKSYEREGPPVAAAHRMAMSTIVGYLNQGKKAEAVNEFIAWSLTNQNIIKIQRKTEVTNPIYRIMGQALTALKQLIWGHKKAPDVGTDMFSNVRFNARVLMATPTPVELFLRDMGEVVMYQSSSFGSSNRLADIRKRFGQHMVQFARQPVSSDPLVNKVTYKDRRTDALEALISHNRIADAMAVPFKMNMQEMSTFKWIGATLSMVDHLNTASLDRMQDIYDAVIDKITPDDFLTNVGDAGVDQYQAQEKYKALTGVGTTQYDKKGRSSQLTNFIALATVNEEFRQILRGMKMPQRIVAQGWTPDAVVERAGQSMANGLAAYASGEGRNNENLLASMEALTHNLIENVGDQRSFIEQKADGGLDYVDNLFKGYIEKGTKKVQAWAATVKNPLGKKAASYLSMLSREFTEEGKKTLDSTRVQFFNQPGMNTTLRETINEIIGRTDENAPVFDMITRTRTFVDQTRQRWREEFPKEVKKWFKEPLTKEQSADLFMGLGKADAASLLTSYDRKRTMELLSSGSSRKAEITRLENMMGAQVIEKTKQLAHWMVTGEHGPQFQRNAHAIAVLNATVEKESDIDALATLYALENGQNSVKATLDSLVGKDPEGIEKMLAALVATYNDEKGKVKSDLARMNGYKGHLKGQQQEGVHLVIADKNDHARLMSMGYVEMGNYKGSTSDVGTEKKGYYFAPVSGRAKFNQGVMQTVQHTQFGVDPDRGYTVGEVMAGRISEPRAVAAITKRISRQGVTSENLLPVYNASGVVIAYERAADPKMLSNLNVEYDLPKALGAWRGRQFEEISSDMVNMELVDKVYNIWNQGRGTQRQNEYIRVDKSTDPVIRDAWNVIPNPTKDYIKQRFGETGFMVRRDMVNDVVGARSATVGDFWTGNSRWSPEVQKQIKDMVVGLAGNKAYSYLVNGEKMIQGFVTDAKVLIVVKSVLVPAINFVSNIHQLSMAGVPIRHILSGFRAKTTELNSYIKRKEQERQLQNDLFVAEGRNDSVNIRKLSARIRALQDSYKNMSIWPLLEAGEFGAITDGGLSKEDIAIAKGGYATMIDKIAQKVPEGVRDVARYSLVTRDTALFKAMSRATQYGDFIAKAVLYDDLTKRKQMDQSKALAYVNEEFVNYNRFPGRGRSYLESMGMTWFWHYKLRSMKVAQRAMQNHPFRALVHSAMMPRMPLLGTVGSPITDNFLSVWLDGRLGYSIGPGMLFRAPQLNPWWNMTH